MNKKFHIGNRENLYRNLQPNSLAVFFSGIEIRKTNDEFYPFFTNRNFLYLTGLDAKEIILLVKKDAEGCVKEKAFILPPDLMTERWSGARLKTNEVVDLSGIEDIGFLDTFAGEFHKLAVSGNYECVYLDLFKLVPEDIDTPAYDFQKKISAEYPYLTVKNANPYIRALRTIKQPCEIEAMRIAEKITCEGITAMMKKSRPGMYEYQYKAEFDYVLGQYSPKGPGFPSIISAGKNNFCIHYYSYQGQACDGDMVLNDVGAWHDNLINDVSRGFPCNGKFNERQRLLYECALRTSDYMFSIIKPGMKMADVDATARRYNFEQLKEAGVLKDYKDIGTYMWHGGAHHVGYDVHDAIKTPETLAPNMVFCVDIGIYHEEWGIGFRIEDNCLVTEDGCENLSSITPRTVAEVEDTMRRGMVSVS
ncbi:MAG: aminopeptidase P N-terminal domain-containing protein [Clostridiales bacterium]|nr:aminopeptidase P N-terminal domain-containing protein [Clostridiales bacterium]